jgi:3-deoxy-D-manno-octulosonic-acid transferase
MYFIYSLLYIIALLFLLPFEYFKRKDSIRKRWIKEKFGFFDSIPKANSHKRLWIHAVSVGEVIAAATFIKRLKDKYKNVEIILSTITDTGQKVSNETLGSVTKIIYLPFDIPFCIKGAIKNIKPDLFILVETELWPNIIRLLHKNNIPLLILNGRISNKSFRNYKKIKFFIKDVLDRIDLFCMQSDSYSFRIQTLGANPTKIITLGNIKFDKEYDLEPLKWTEGLKQKDDIIIVGGSTHSPEEDLILDTYVKLKRVYPELKLIIAPRHPERFKDVEELIKKRGIDYIKRSNISHDKGLSTPVILLNVIGELAKVYSICDIAIMGGSFIPHGGQNPFEPAYWGKAVVCGPHMENFPMIEDFYKNSAAIETTKERLYDELKGLLDNPERRLSIGQSAQELFRKNKGATERAIEIISSILSLNSGNK